MTVNNTIQSFTIPQTGDYNNLWLWFMMLGICTTGGCSVLFFGKKKKAGKYTK